MHQVWSRHEGDGPRVQPCRPPYSFYDLVERLWDNAQTAKWPLHRFLSLMRVMEATHFVEEVLETGPSTADAGDGLREIQYELSSVARRVDADPAQLDMVVRRFTFFWAPTDEADWRTLPEDSVIAYFVHVAIRLPDKKNSLAYILEAVVRPPAVGRFAPDGSVRVEPINRCLYLHCQSPFQTSIGRRGESRDFRLNGTFFTQQNRLTHVCAHAALRIALNSSIHLTGGLKVTNELINETLGITHDHPDRRIGTYGSAKQDRVGRNRGLTRTEISRVLEGKLGLGVGLLNCKQMADLEFDDFAYPSMESGWPLLIGLEGVNLKNGQQVDHVLTVLGHTLDPFRWSPEARHGYGMLPRSSFLSAVEWTDHFVINDDGYGMHMTLQSDIVRNFIAPHRNASLHVMFVMDIRPNHVKFDGLNATTVSTDLLRNFCKQVQGKIEGKWLTRLTQSRELVCRTLHVSRDEYVRSLVPSMGALGPAVEEKLAKLPDSFWLTEFALPPLYTANGRKLADVVMRSDESTANRPASDVYSRQWELIWLPGAVQFRGQDPSSWPITGPIEMMRSGGSLLIH